MKRFAVLLIVLMLSYRTMSLGQNDAEITPEPPVLDAIRAVFSADDLSPRLGEPISLTITVEMPAEAEVVDFPQFPTDWGPFMVRVVGELVATTGENGREIYTQDLTVILWDVGDFNTPDTFVGYQLVGEDEVFYAPVRRLVFVVPSMLNPDMNRNELRPLKSQIVLFYVPWWVIVGGLVVVSGALWVGYRWYRYRSTRTVPQVTKPLDPIVVVRESLARVDAERDEVEDSCTVIETALRRYITLKWHIEAQHLTTADLLQSLEVVLDAEMIQDLERILTYLEQVRFSGHEPGHKSVKQLVARSLNWLDAVDEVEFVADHDELEIVPDHG